MINNDIYNILILLLYCFYFISNFIIFIIFIFILLLYIYILYLYNNLINMNIIIYILNK